MITYASNYKFYEVAEQSSKFVLSHGTSDDTFSDATHAVSTVLNAGPGNYTHQFQYNGSHPSSSESCLFLTSDHDCVSGGKILIALFLSCLIAGTIFGNVLVFMSVICYRWMQSFTNVLLISLSTADLLVGILILPPAMLYLAGGRWPFNELACKIWATADVLLCTASILNLCVISLDRYFAISWPMTYITHRNCRTAALLITFVWSIALLVCLPPWLNIGNWGFSFEENTCGYVPELSYRIYSSVGSFFLPSFIMLFVYYRIYIVTISREEKINSNRSLSMRIKIHRGGGGKGYTPRISGKYLGGKAKTCGSASIRMALESSASAIALTGSVPRTSFSKAGLTGLDTSETYFSQTTLGQSGISEESATIHLSPTSDSATNCDMIDVPLSTSTKAHDRSHSVGVIKKPKFRITFHHKQNNVQEVPVSESDDDLKLSNEKVHNVIQTNSKTVSKIEQSSVPVEITVENNDAQYEATESVTDCVTGEFSLHSTLEGSCSSSKTSSETGNPHKLTVDSTQSMPAMKIETLNKNAICATEPTLINFSTDETEPSCAPLQSHSQQGPCGDKSVSEPRDAAPAAGIEPTVVANSSTESSIMKDHAGITCSCSSATKETAEPKRRTRIMFAPSVVAEHVRTTMVTPLSDRCRSEMSNRLMVAEGELSSSDNQSPTGSVRKSSDASQSGRPRKTNCDKPPGLKSILRPSIAPIEDGSSTAAPSPNGTPNSTVRIHQSGGIADLVLMSKRVSIVAAAHSLHSAKPLRALRDRAATSASAAMKERKALKTISIVVSGFIICWFPFFVTYLLESASPTGTVPPDLMAFFLWLGYSNSAINPIIYAFCNNDFRRCFRDLLSCGCTKKSFQRTQSMRRMHRARL